MDLEFSARTDVGRVRANNEDAVHVDAARRLMVLADGMGGYNAGEVASAMAIECITTELGQWLDAARADTPVGGVQRAIERCIEMANRAIFEAANTRPDCAGMGTTVVLALVWGRQLLLAHVGDSRAYRWQRGALTQLTRDHSLLQEQLDAGLITPLEAAQSGYRSLITRALGVEDTVLVDHQVLDLQGGETFLLCSDGLTEMVPDLEIAGVLGAGGSLDEQASTLIDLANLSGGRDNVSVILMHLKEMAKMSGFVSRLLKK
ncbi:MAG TPA: Stp1/IreP family PP2C-type Ser/Thr phosphatase [Ottowia sp.]|uniref:Stp1/IreP family PP2C-type Ser/Thr phosphatase n=1 Tax=Ottowia sp. TaxID=1898956 RepID=UPI002C5A9D67|nr:Stp1/IreP family PP2C-type Ser/Thr phosphatase [Ottowia sp.]HMN22624.1 Stp1/IreP family PP2C-type Ser/Thr phosphatase [Ottowia sp.]